MGENVVAYIGYNAEVRVAPSRTLPRSARAKLAWGRLAVVAASLLAWTGIIAAARAIF
jgi:hypothetical protein